MMGIACAPPILQSFHPYPVGWVERSDTHRQSLASAHQRGVPKTCVQYTPNSLLRSTLKATPISVYVEFIRLAQCDGLLIHPPTAPSGVDGPAAIFSPVARNL